MFCLSPYISCRHRKNISLTPRRIFSGGNWAKLGRLFPGQNSKRDKSELDLRGGQEITPEGSNERLMSGRAPGPSEETGRPRPAAGVRGIR